MAQDLSQNCSKTVIKLSACSNTISQPNFYLYNGKMFKLSILFPFLSAKTLAVKQLFIHNWKSGLKLKYQSTWNIFTEIFGDIRGPGLVCPASKGLLGNWGWTLINFGGFLSTFSFLNCRRLKETCRLLWADNVAGPCARTGHFLSLLTADVAS